MKSKTYVVLENKKNLIMIDKTIEIRNHIIHRIERINDNLLLQEIYNMINTKSSEDILTISTEQMESINKGRQDIKDGKYITNEDLMLKMSEWLEKE